MGTALLQGLARASVLLAIMFGAAGRWDLPFFWGYAAVCAVMGVLAYQATSRHPGLMQEQIQPKGKGRDGAVSYIAMGLMIAQWVLGGVDVGRMQWTPPSPIWMQCLGLIVMAGAYGVGYWALLENPFFSPVVRVQSERGHAVVVSGPYRHVRHPAYFGTCFGMAGGALALGSVWAALPAVLIAILYVRRTWIEDAFLRSHLDGYEAYYQRVRYALLPGVW